MNLSNNHSPKVSRIALWAIKKLSSSSNSKKEYVANELQLSSIIGELKSLEVLKIAGNNLSEIPDEIGNLCNLIELDLSFNQIKEVPQCLNKLNRLTRLDISGHIYKSFCVPIYLAFGFLSNVEIDGIEILKELPLKKLNLNHRDMINIDHLFDLLISIKPTIEEIHLKGIIFTENLVTMITAMMQDAPNLHTVEIDKNF